MFNSYLFSVEKMFKKKKNIGVKTKNIRLVNFLKVEKITNHFFLWIKLIIIIILEIFPGKILYK